MSLLRFGGKDPQGNAKGINVNDDGNLTVAQNRQHSFWKGESFTSAEEIHWPIRINSTNLKLSFKFVDSISIPDSYTISVREYDLSEVTTIIDTNVIYEGGVDTGETVNFLREIDFEVGSQVIGIIFNDNSSVVEERNINFFKVGERDVNYTDIIKKTITNQYSVFDHDSSEIIDTPYASDTFELNSNKGILLYEPGPGVDVGEVKIQLLHVPTEKDSYATSLSQTIFDGVIPTGLPKPFKIPFIAWSNKFRVRIVRDSGFPVVTLGIAEVVDFPDSISNLLPQQKIEEQLLTATVDTDSDNSITPHRDFRNVLIENKSQLHQVKVAIAGVDYFIDPQESRNIKILQKGTGEIIYNSVLGTANIRLLFSDEIIEKDRAGISTKFEYASIRGWRVLHPRGNAKFEVFVTDSDGLGLYKGVLNRNNISAGFISAPVLLHTFEQPIIDIFFTSNRSCLLATGTVGQSDMKLWKTPSQDFFETTINEITIGASSPWFPRTGISESRPATIVFGEYANDGTDTSLWRSVDDGDTWTEVLTAPDIRHWHTVEADLYEGDVFYATSGDSGPQIRWYVSTDDGSTFAEIADVNAEQSEVYKCLGLVITDSHIVWATDAPGCRNSIYKAPKNNLVGGRKEVVRSNQVFFGILDANDFLLAHAVTQHGTGGTLSGSWFGEIYVSFDNGETWEIVSQWEARRSGNAGFRFSTIPSINGVVYLSTDRDALEGHSVSANSLLIKTKNF